MELRTLHFKNPFILDESHHFFFKPPFLFIEYFV